MRPRRALELRKLQESCLNNAHECPTETRERRPAAAEKPETTCGAGTLTDVDREVARNARRTRVGRLRRTDAHETDIRRALDDAMEFAEPFAKRTRNRRRRWHELARHGSATPDAHRDEGAFDGDVALRFALDADSSITRRRVWIRLCL